MYTSGINMQKTDAVKTSFVYLVASLVCVVFGAVYEYFSHEVYSEYMIYAFVFPLFGGTLPFLTIFLLGKPMPKKIVRGLYHCGVMTFTVGSIVKGILEIYGTTNRLTSIYWMAGAVLCIAALVILLFGEKNTKNGEVK